MHVNDPIILRFTDGEPVIPPGRRRDFWVLDRQLPLWARRSNPIIRRHLGGFWKASLPVTRQIGLIVLLQLGLLLLTIPMPGLLEMITLLGLMALFVLPPALVTYGRALLNIGWNAAGAILYERRGQMLDILRTTPFSLREILLAKIAASIWHDADNLNTVVYVAAMLSLPAIVIQQASLYPPNHHAPAVQLLMGLGLITTILRLFVEPVMVAAVAIAAGTIADFDVSATSSAGVVVVSYLVLVNLLRLLPLSWPLRLVVEDVLPIVLPLLITWGALHLAKRTLHRD